MFEINAKLKPYHLYIKFAESAYFTPFCQSFANLYDYLQTFYAKSAGPIFLLEFDVNELA